MLFISVHFVWLGICLLLLLFALYCCVATRLLFVCLFELDYLDCW